MKDLLRIEDEFSPVGKYELKFQGSMPSQRASEATIEKKGWMDGWMDERKDGWMDGRKGGIKKGSDDKSKGEGKET